MSRFILDTSFLVELLATNPSKYPTKLASQKFNFLINNSVEVLIPMIVHFEFSRSLKHNLKKYQDNGWVKVANRYNDLVQNFGLLGFSHDAFIIASDIWSEMGYGGKTKHPHSVDVLIAGLSVAYEATLVSFDRDFLRISQKFGEFKSEVLPKVENQLGNII